jgi:serine-type D-Ala-D-Ala carboxypeptidase/endopeptidase (penicillin-binding protein 4)
MLACLKRLAAPAAISAVAALGAFSAVPAAALAGTPRKTTTPAGLSRAITGYMHAAGGSGSALVYDETSGKTLMSVGANTARLPASVEKLYTTSTALFEFGPDATLQTRVYGVGTLSATGAWSGTLYLQGGGDPTFGDAGFDAANYGTGATVQELVALLKAKGITRVSGTIVGDESWFDSDRGTPATGNRPNSEVEGELSGLSYDAGFTSGAETQLQPRPALWAAQAFASVMGDDGIKVVKGTRETAGITPTDATLLASEDSPTIETLIRLTNSPSDNFFAETLLKDVGAKFGGGGTTADGVAVVRKVIAAKLGLAPRFDDGSGLSRYDRTTATQVVSLLRQMRSNTAFMDSLAVAGVSGTMDQEMLGTRAVNNCRGKTGTLHDVANLVGVCTAENGDQLVFAFLLNSLQNSTYGHELEDDMGVDLADYDGPIASASGVTTPAS